MKQITFVKFRGKIDNSIKYCESVLYEAIHTRLCLNEHLENFNASLEVCDFQEAQNCIKQMKQITSVKFRGDIDSYVELCESELYESELCEAKRTRVCLNEHLEKFNTSLKECDFQGARDCIEQMRQMKQITYVKHTANSYVKLCESELCEAQCESEPCEAQNRDELSILLHKLLLAS